MQLKNFRVSGTNRRFGPKRMCEIRDFCASKVRSSATKHPGSPLTLFTVGPKHPDPIAESVPPKSIVGGFMTGKFVGSNEKLACKISSSRTLPVNFPEFFKFFHT